MAAGAVGLLRNGSGRFGLWLVSGHVAGLLLAVCCCVLFMACVGLAAFPSWLMRLRLGRVDIGGDGRLLPCRPKRKPRSGLGFGGFRAV